MIAMFLYSSFHLSLSNKFMVVAKSQGVHFVNDRPVFFPNTFATSCFCLAAEMLPLVAKV